MGSEMIWSKLRKKIKDFITPGLRDRIDVHCTRYHDAHDDYGEAWITLDGQKVLGGGYYHWYMAHIPQELINKLGFQGAYHKDFYLPQIELREVKEIMELGIHETTHIRDVLENYINTPFEDCLESNNPIYTAFALIDKRLGKRRFLNIDISNYKHPLVKLFYELRRECFRISDS
ncbi:hypothetical protein [Dehalobacter sp. MCB1]|uniref:SF0329 family protein n=2 Tax=Dehalobacter TaxID=56112 RepID=UPI00105035D6|nr:hypothetical protein [Dehalobacter sp. MCB1]